MKTYMWKKWTEIKKSLVKCIELITIPLVVWVLYVWVFPLESRFLVFMLPVTISGIIYYVSYNVDDIACAGIYSLVGISQKTVWLSNITICMVTGYAVTLLFEIITMVLRSMEFQWDYITCTLASLPFAFVLIGTSTVHYLSNSKRQMIAASVGSLLNILLAPMVICVNKIFQVANISTIAYCAAGLALIIVGYLLFRYMSSKRHLEELIVNSRTYIEGYDKNFFAEE